MRSALSPTKADVAPRWMNGRASGADVAEGVDVRHHVVLRLALVPVGGRELVVGRDEVRAAAPSIAPRGSARPSSRSASASQSQSRRHVANLCRAEKSADISAEA